MENRYYKVFEDRKPYMPAQFSLWKDSLFQIASIVFIFVGADYLYWRGVGIILLIGTPLGFPFPCFGPN